MRKGKTKKKTKTCACDACTGWALQDMFVYAKQIETAGRVMYHNFGCGDVQKTIQCNKHSLEIVLEACARIRECFSAIEEHRHEGIHG